MAPEAALSVEVSRLSPYQVKRLPTVNDSDSQGRERIGSVTSGERSKRS